VRKCGEKQKKPPAVLQTASRTLLKKGLAKSREDAFAIDCGKNDC